MNNSYAKCYRCWRVIKKIFSKENHCDFSLIENAVVSEEEYHQQFLIALHKKNYKLAFQVISLAYSGNHFSFYNLYYMGYFYHRTGSNKDAFIFYNKALEIVPNHLWALIRVSELNREIGDVVSACNIARKVIELYEDDAWAWQNLGKSLMALKNYPESLFAFSKSLILDDNKYIKKKYFKLINKIKRSSQLTAQYELIKNKYSLLAQNKVKDNLTKIAITNILDLALFNPVNVDVVKTNRKNRFAIYKNNIWLETFNTGLKKILGQSIDGIENIDGYTHSHDIYCIWGVNQQRLHLSYYLFLKEYNKQVMFIEDGFIRSIFPVHKKSVENILRVSCSYSIDSLSCYYDATRATNLENYLNTNFSLSDAQLKRVNYLIKTIRDNFITKYNHQPLIDLEIPKRHRVLVVDQSYGDISIDRGLADESSFQRMLDSAIKENPDSIVIVKTHPDSLLNNTKIGYFDNGNRSDVLYLKYEINPIYLLSQVDKVYVVTSQLGFEALLMRKEVVTFGIPFYAGWGMTDDRCKITRRTARRTVEEVFYAVYIVHSIYYNPELQSHCEIEEAIAFIIKYRKMSVGW